MKLKEDIHPITYLKSNAADLLEQINTTHRPVIITQNGAARAVLQDAESYEKMRYAIGLLKLIAQGETDVQAGRTIAADKVFTDLHSKLSASRD